MARRSKSNPLMGILLIGFIIIVVKWNTITLSVTEFFSEHGMKITLFFVFVVTITIISCSKTKKKIEKIKSDDYSSFCEKVSRFIPVLSRKRRFLITVDDYGYIDASKWENEKEGFLNKLDYFPLKFKGYPGLSRKEQVMIIESLVDRYQTENGVSISYSDGMSPIEYEAYCAEVLTLNGWSARTTKASGDQGADVIAELNGVTVAIQCKKYSRPIGNSAVQEVSSGMKFWGAQRGVVVTNATYTRSARQLANAEDVLLIHHDQLANLKDALGI